MLHAAVDRDGALPFLTPARRSTWPAIATERWDRGRPRRWPPARLQLRPRPQGPPCAPSVWPRL